MKTVLLVRFKSCDQCRHPISGVSEKACAQAQLDHAKYDLMKAAMSAMGLPLEVKS